MVIKVQWLGSDLRVRLKLSVVLLVLNLSRPEPAATCPRRNGKQNAGSKCAATHSPAVAPMHNFRPVRTTHSTSERKDGSAYKGPTNYQGRSSRCEPCEKVGTYLGSIAAVLGEHLHLRHHPLFALGLPRTQTRTIASCQSLEAGGLVSAGCIASRGNGGGVCCWDGRPQLHTQVGNFVLARDCTCNRPETHASDPGHCFLSLSVLVVMPLGRARG